MMRFIPLLSLLTLCTLSVAGCEDDSSSSSAAPPGGGDAGTSGTSGGMQSPPGVIVEGPEQGLYVTDYAGAIFHLSLEDGKVLGKHGTQGKGVNQYVTPTDIAATKKHLYVADSGNRRIVRLTAVSGAGWKELALAADAEPEGVGAFLSEDDEEETVVFSDFATMQFFAAPKDFEGEPVPLAKLKYNTCSVAVRGNTAVGTAGCSSGVALNVVVSTSTGDRFYPEADNTGLLRRPDGVAFLPDGTLVIADTGNYRVLCARGASGDFGKQGSEGDLEFLAVSAIATDDRGRIFVADTGRKRIVRVDDCTGANPKVLYEGDEISQITGLAAVGPYQSVQGQ